MKQEKRPSDRPLLSFAIPTYNRAKYLDQLLGVLLKQLDGESRVEVIVSDNASTDNTPTVVEMHRQQGLSIRYLHNETNRGPDFNILQCYEQAAGKYVWIFGDDDLILEGGVSSVLSLLELEELDFVFLAPYVFRESTSEIRPRRRIAPTQIADDPIKLVSLANLHADLIFISAGIVNKDRVSSLPHPPFSALLDTNLVQLGWIFTSLRNLRRGVFVQMGILAGRAGNSSGGFTGARVFGENFQRAVSVMLEPESKLAEKLLNDHLKMWFPRNWLQFRKAGEDARSCDRILRRAFRGNLRYWICVYPLVHAPLYLAKLWAKALRVPARIQMERMSTLLMKMKGSQLFVTVAPVRGLSSPDISSKIEEQSVAAIVVLYLPDYRLLERLLSSVVDQVNRIFVIDNSPNPDSEISKLLKDFDERVAYFPLGDNMGIATAQNIGIRESLKTGHSHVLLLDQDSCLSPGMIVSLLASERELITSGKKVAAVGPLFVDEKTGKCSFAMRPGFFGVRRISLNADSGRPVETDHLIASGSLISTASLDAIGLMRDDLFIDWVDIEWGLRAQQMGFISYIIPSVTMRHSIGDATVRFMGRDVNLHNDLRNYYMVRNATYLLRSGCLKSWRWITLLKVIKYVVFYSIYSKNQRKSSSLLLTAVVHGLRGRLGRLA